MPPGCVTALPRRRPRRNAPRPLIRTPGSREAAEIAVAEYVEGIFKQDSFSLKSQIAGAESAIEKAGDRLERTRKARERVREAAKEGTRTPADIVAELDIEDRLIDAEHALEREKTALEVAKSRLTVLEKYTLPKTTKSLKVEVERKRSEELARRTSWELEKEKRAKLQRQIGSCVIHAPADGVVVYANDPSPRREGRGRTNIEEGATRPGTSNHHETARPEHAAAGRHQGTRIPRRPDQPGDEGTRRASTP